MPHGKSLDLREIQPRIRWRGYEPNPARVHDRAEAKRLGISVRRYKKMQKKARRA